MNNVCFILNYAPHYRKGIFKMVDKVFRADFYFGNLGNSSIEKIDYSELCNFRRELKTIKFLKLKWILGSVLLVFKKYRYYVLTGDSMIISNWFILGLLLVQKKKAYLWTHGLLGNEAFLERKIKVFYYKLAYKILLYENSAKKLLEREGMKSTNLLVLYNSLDYNLQIEIRRKLNISSIYKNYFNNSNNTLIFIGRISPDKRIDVLLSAIKILKEKDFFLNLVLIGKVYDYNLYKIVKSFALQDNVWFYGPSYNETTNGELLYNASLCVCPGSIGLTAIHSLTYGTPVCTHNNLKRQKPEVEAIIDNYNGILFNENDPVDLANRMETWFKMNKSREMIRDQCYQIVDKRYNPNYQVSLLRKEFTEKGVNLIFDENCY